METAASMCIESKEIRQNYGKPGSIVLKAHFGWYGKIVMGICLLRSLSVFMGGMRIIA